VDESWRALLIGELHILYSSQDIIRVTKSKRMKLARHVARVVNVTNSHKILV
jgi:hypothetical protein